MRLYFSRIFTWIEQRKEAILTKSSELTKALRLNVNFTFEWGYPTYNAWKVSVFEVVLFRIIPHSEWIAPNTGTFYAVLLTLKKYTFHIFPTWFYYFKTPWIVEIKYP